MSADERDASPERFFSSTTAADREHAEANRDGTREEKVERTEEISRQVTASSSASSVSTASIRHEAINTSASRAQPSRNNSYGISLVPTQHENEADLERHPTALSRIQTARTQHSATIGATSLRSRTATRHSKTPLPAFGAGKPYPPNLPEREEFVVEFDGPNDPLHAQNWPLAKKMRVAVTLGFVTLTAAFGSSIFSAAIGSVARIYGVSSEVGILGVSLYVLGFATGPLVWAPASELYGRKWPLLTSSFGFSIFSIAVAVAKDIQTIFISRFFSGFFGACPLTCVGAVFADMFNNRQRGLAITVFSMTVFSGPLFAPFIGGFINMSYLGWRWTEYIVAIMGFLGLGLSFAFLEETYPPVILVNKAADLRRRTKNWGIHAKQEEIEIDFRELVEKNLSRPLRMLFTEPIVLALSIYMAFVYGLLYLMLTLYPIIFQRIHGMNPGVGGLPFFGMILGELFAGLYMLLIQPSYNRKLAANNNMPIPEWRMPPVIIGGSVFAVGQFWLGWYVLDTHGSRFDPEILANDSSFCRSGYKSSIHWIAPTLSGLFTGFGILSIFLQCLNYLIDAYLML